MGDGRNLLCAGRERLWGRDRFCLGVTQMCPGRAQHLPQPDLFVRKGRGCTRALRKDDGEKLLCCIPNPSPEATHGCEQAPQTSPKNTLELLGCPSPVEVALVLLVSGTLAQSFLCPRSWLGSRLCLQFNSIPRAGGAAQVTPEDGKSIGNWFFKGLTESWTT